MAAVKHVFIINPSAGKKRSTRALVDSIQALDVPYEIAFTEKTGDARRIARAAAEGGGAVRIYACGGDGTLNEAVNGAAGYENAAVTNVPTGTGNDFLKIFGRENKARFTDLEALSQGPQAAMDLIDCNGLLGIDIVCAGIDARIAEDKDKYKALPPVSGIGAYILSLIVNVLFKSIAAPAVVDCGDLHFDGETTIICVCSGRYYGGGFETLGEELGCDTRIILIDAEMDSEAREKYSKKYQIVSADKDSTARHQIVSMVRRKRKTLPVSKNDQFMFTAWWSAYIIQNEY